jgi:ABC-type multidrug transport system fused ATPase/permease subunit
MQQSSGQIAASSGVFVYGQNVKDVSLESLRGIMAVVPQDTVLFNDSIAANIAYGRAGMATLASAASHQTEVDALSEDERLPTISATTQHSLSLLRVPLSQVVAAAKASHLHDTIINHFPQQYNTMVGERGLRLSGGEKSRVAIARAYLKDSPILLCDEMTASLDMATEESVMRSLTQLNATTATTNASLAAESMTSQRTPKTMVLVAHRLSTIRKADIIYVLDKGQVVEKGTHGHLMSGANGTVGLYKKLWERQQHEQEEADEQGKTRTEAEGTTKL